VVDGPSGWSTLEIVQPARRIDHNENPKRSWYQLIPDFDEAKVIVWRILEEWQVRIARLVGLSVPNFAVIALRDMCLVP
jgi:hypothetical protein